MAPYLGLCGPMPSADVPGTGGREDRTMITLEHVSKSYGGFTAVDDVSFTAKPGRVTGFLGPNGAG